MIKNGSWEIDIYPHYPRDIYKGVDDKDIKYTFYIVFEGEILEGNIIYKSLDRDDKPRPSYFLFIHPKTTPIKDDNRNLVYMQDSSALPNYRRKITKPTSLLEKKIVSFFAKDKVFYSDNETGEIMRNYIEWCKA